MFGARECIIEGTENAVNQSRTVDKEIPDMPKSIAQGPLFTRY